MSAGSCTPAIGSNMAEPAMRYQCHGGALRAAPIRSLQVSNKQGKQTRMRGIARRHRSRSRHSHPHSPSTTRDKCK